MYWWLYFFKQKHSMSYSWFWYLSITKRTRRLIRLAQNMNSDKSLINWRSISARYRGLLEHIRWRIRPSLRYGYRRWKRMQIFDILHSVNTFGKGINPTIQPQRWVKFKIVGQTNTEFIPVLIRWKLTSQGRGAG